MKNEFGAEIQRGKNELTLSMLDEYYKVYHSKSVSRYEFVTDTSSCIPINIKSSHKNTFRRCSICGTTLYNFRHDSDGSIFLKSKRVVLSHLSDGTIRYSCYGVKTCIKNGMKDNVPIAHSNISFYPSFSEWVDLLGGESILRVPVPTAKDSLFERAKESYNKYVVPFFEKWFTQEVSKMNLSEFLEDYRYCCIKHLLYYENATTVRTQILKTIGVRIEC